MKGMIFMRKDFGKQTIVTPLPVVIIATYGDDGRPDAMNAAWGGQVDTNMVHVELDNSHLTTDNIKRRKAFTVSFADRKNLVMADISASSPAVRKTRSPNRERMWKRALTWTRPSSPTFR